MQRLRLTLQRSLFRPATSETLRLSRLEGAFAILAFLVLAGALQLLRLDPAESVDTLWAEDGPVFLGGAMGLGLWDALTTPYAGYLVVAQRLIGEAGNLVPLPDAAMVMAVTAALTVGLTGIVVWFASAAHIRSQLLRGLLVVLTVLSPVAGVEAVVSGTNVAWYMTFGAFWLLLWRPRATWSACLGGVFILLTGLSSPALFFFAPLAALRAIAIRDRRDAAIVGGFGLALAIQLPVMLQSDQPPAEKEWLAEIGTVLLQRVVDGSVLGLELGSAVWKSWGWPFLIGLTALVALYLAALAYRARSGRLLALIALATSAAMFVASVYQRGITLTLLWPEGTYNFLGTRYAMVPCLLFVSAALVLLDHKVESSRAWRGVAVAMAAVLLLGLVSSFRIGERTGPAWRDSLERTAAECESKGGLEALVHVSPQGMTMRVPCEQLSDSPRRSVRGPAPPDPHASARLRLRG